MKKKTKSKILKKGDILNIDVGTLSNEFYENEYALDAMASAA